MADQPTSSNTTQHGRTFQQIKEQIAQDALAMQQPSQFIMMMLYGLSLYSATRICVEAGIFRRLAASPDPISSNDLATGLPSQNPDNNGGNAHARQELITRMLRSVCGMKLVDEAGPEKYQGNELTRTLAHPGFEAGVMFMYQNLLGPQSTMSAMAEWATSNSYEAPEVATDGPFQRARNAVGTASFPYYTKHDPMSLSNLNVWMQRIQQDRLNWSEWFPAETIFAAGVDEEEEEGVFMVDVGGGLGHDLNGFAKQYPEKKVKLVLQDMPEVIREAREQELDGRIEVMEHDFFARQPVKGAKIYFMHKIIHDWPDKECVQILTQLRDAMASDSRLFLNDAIIPDEGSPVLFSAFDLSMLLLLSAKERSESMWTSLIEKVGGLTIKKFWQAPALAGEGIVEVVKTS